MIEPILLLLLAGFLIYKGSDLLTDSLLPLAEVLGTNYVAVTTLIVSFFLSIPEIFTSVYSYMLGHLDISLGIITGSVMLNVGITVGLSASIRPLRIEKDVVLRDGIFLIISALVVLLFGTDLQYTFSEGAVLLLLFIPYSLNVWSFEKWKSIALKQERVEDINENLNLIGYFTLYKTGKAFLGFLLGGLMLLGGSYLLSRSLISLSSQIGIPEMLIGMVIGSLGTGAPNIAAAIQGTLKGYRDAALTETFGSNIFTLLVTLGILTMLKPFSITGRMFSFDLNWMIILHLLLIAFIIKGYRYQEESLTRFEGVVLVIFYIMIIIANVFAGA